MRTSAAISLSIERLTVSLTFSIKIRKAESDLGVKTVR